MSDSYFSLFKEYPPWNIASLIALTFFRIIPILVLSPFLGGSVLPSPPKIGFALMLSLVMFPFLEPMSVEGLTNGFNIAPLAIQQVGIGFIIGLLTTIPFNVASSAGAIIDHQRGAASLMVTDPATATSTTPIGILLNEVMLVLFFLIGGPILFFDALILSFQQLPPGKFLNAPFFTSANIFWHNMILLMNTLFSLAVRFAAPSLIAMLMADIFLGIANRLAPQVQIAFLGMPLKSLLGITLLFMGWFFILRHMSMATIDWMQTVIDLMKTLGIKADGTL